MSLARHCDAEGCHEEQPIRPDDDNPAFTEGEWITLDCEEMDPPQRQFCGPSCARRWLVAVDEAMLVQAGLMEAKIPDGVGEGVRPGMRREIKHPSEPWDPRKDSPFPAPKRQTDDDAAGSGATV